MIKKINALIAPSRLSLQNVRQKGFFHLLGANYLIQIVGFASQLFVAWFLSPTDLGRIKILQTYLMIGIIISGLGFNTSVLKLCSEKRGEYEKIFIYKGALKYTVISSIFSYFISLVFIYFGLISSDPVINYYAIFYFIMLIPQSFFALDTSFLQAIKEIIKLAKVQAVNKIVTLLLIVLLTYLFAFKGYIFSVIVGSIISSLFLFLIIKKSIREKQSKQIPDLFNLHWKYAKYSFLANGIGQISLFSDIFLINYMIKDRVTVGYYSFALTLILGLQTLTSTVQQIATPYFSEKSNDFYEWKKIFNKYNRKFNISMLLVCLLALIT